MQQFDIAQQTSAGQYAVRQNRVLRNTYALLAVSMVPTVLGAFVGIQLNIPLFSGFLGAILFMGIAFGFFWAIEKNKHSGTGVALLLGFTFFMGLMLSGILRVALGFSNGGSMIALAAGGTATIFFVLSSVAANTKRDFSGMGKFLFAGAVLLIVASLANIFFQVPAVSLAIAALVVAIFSGFILYDINRIVQGGEDNYITATLAVYLDIYNVFVGLLQLIMAFTGERD